MALPFCLVPSGRKEIKQYPVTALSSEGVELIPMQEKQGDYEYSWGFVHLHQRSIDLFEIVRAEHRVFENKVRRSAYSYRYFRERVL